MELMMTKRNDTEEQLDKLKEDLHALSNLVKNLMAPKDHFLNI
jgi:hypothetical protein